MRRILLLAKRDYLQTVLTKAYLFGLILLPLLVGGGMLATAQLNKATKNDQRIAVIDRTGGSPGVFIEALEESNRARLTDAGVGMLTQPRYVFETVKPAADAPAQLLSLSERIRRGELLLVLDVSSGASQAEANSAGVAGGEGAVHYYTNSTAPQLAIWLRGAVNDGLRRVRLAQLNVDRKAIPGVLRDVPLVAMDLLTEDKASGDISPATRRNILQTQIVPMFMVVMLMLVVLSGAAPQLGAVAEDKMQKVFEMLLTSASPFELMAGKVLAGLGASLTSAIFYIGGTLLALSGMALIGIAPLHLLPWFFVYLIANVTMLSASSVAVGSACATPQDAQSLAFLLFLPIFVPMMTLPVVMQDPSGTVATVMSLIPPFTPLLMMIRQALPGGVPWWQAAFGFLGMSAWAVFLVWAGARIFRIGILSQGNTPKLAELARWVARG